jgi:hypothetical protein
MLRADFIRPMRLKPAKTDDKPIFILVEENRKKILKGTVIPTTISGQYNGIMPINSVHDKPQPQLILKAKPKSIELEGPEGHPSQKVPGLEHDVAQYGSEYKNPDPGHTAGPKASKPTPKASKQPSYQPPSNIQTSSVGTHTPVTRQKPQAGYQPPPSIRTAGVGSSKKTAAPQKQSSYQPPAGTKTLELSLKEETEKSVQAINELIASLQK